MEYGESLIALLIVALIGWLGFTVCLGWILRRIGREDYRGCSITQSALDDVEEGERLLRESTTRREA